MKHFQPHFAVAYLVDDPDPQALQPGLAESHQFGGCLVLGVQVASGLHDFRGRNGAGTISGLCGVSASCSPPSTGIPRNGRPTAWAQRGRGGRRGGLFTNRDEVGLTPRRGLRTMALPSEIRHIEKLHGYVRFPGPLALICGERC